VWTSLLQVFLGSILPQDQRKNFKAPDAITKFKAIQGLPNGDKDKLFYLRRVTTGEINLNLMVQEVCTALS